VFGVEKEDLIELNDVTLPPKIIYEWPRTAELPWRQLVNNFAFPFDVDVQQIDTSRSFNEIEQIIY
jgi:hypothetical protein